MAKLQSLMPTAEHPVGVTGEIIPAPGPELTSSFPTGATTCAWDVTGEKANATAKIATLHTLLDDFILSTLHSRQTTLLTS